jgi:adenylate kinase
MRVDNMPITDRLSLSLSTSILSTFLLFFLSYSNLSLLFFCFLSFLGKSTTCRRIAELTGLEHIEVGRLIADKKLYETWNTEYDVSEFDEDKLCDELEQILSEGGKVVEFHSCDFMPERWFELVIVLRTDNTLLYPRLEARGYSSSKITLNIDCEIAQVCLDEAKEAWPAECVIELRSDNAEDLESNAQRTAEWYQNYMNNQKE